MNDLQIFNSDEFGEIRTLEIEGEPWFIAKDVCRALVLTNITETLRRLDEDELTSVKLNSGGQTREMKAVNEPGLYRLISASRAENARKFQRWVYHEVLPSTRKHGVYMTPATIEKVLLNPDFIIKLATELKAEREKNAILQPKADYYDAVLTSEDAIPVTVIAKEYGMSGVTFNKLLNSEQIQFVRDNIWLLYRKYDNRGYTVTQTLNVNRLNRMYTRWTQKGREFLYHFLKARGIVPVRERVEPMATLF